MAKTCSPKEASAYANEGIFRLLQTNPVVAHCFNSSETYEIFLENAVIELARRNEEHLKREIERFWMTPQFGYPLKAR